MPTFQAHKCGNTTWWWRGWVLWVLVACGAAGAVDDAAIAPASPVRCLPRQAGAPAWIDNLQHTLYLTVCRSAGWFDGLFGPPPDMQAIRSAYGRIGIFPYWSDQDGWRVGMRFRAHVSLPAIEDRLQLLIGRGPDDDDLSRDAREPENPIPFPAAFGDLAADEAWLVGLGYTSRETLHNQWSLGGGVRLASPLDPYIHISYRHDVVVGPRSVLRLRETLFWRASRNFGASTESTFDWLVRPDAMVRLHGTGTIAGDTLGVEWTSQLAWYENVGNGRTLTISAIAGGDSGAEIPMPSYGLDVVVRMQVIRPWLFVEIRGGLHWLRQTAADARHGNPGLGIGFEMYFGPVPPRELH